MFTQYMQSVRETLSTAQSVAIVLGQNPSYDATAAGLALYLSLLQDNKSVKVISPTLPTVGYSDLVGIDKIKNEESGMGLGNGLVISLPYQQGAIEKISYDIVGERINLTVVPGPQGLNFTTEDIEYQSPNQKVQLIITIGVTSENDFASFLEENKEASIINIDNSVQNTGYGTVPLVDASYSSLSEIVAMMLTDLSLPFDIDSAQNLLSGIINETNNFQDEKTGPDAFNAAAMLLQKGARRGSAMQKPQPSFDQEPMRTQNNTRVNMPQQQPMPQQNQPKDRVDELREALSNMSNKPQQAPNPVSQLRQKDNNANKQKAPKDWFEPKIYKSSTQV